MGHFPTCFLPPLSPALSTPNFHFQAEQVLDQLLIPQLTTVAIPLRLNPQSLEGLNTHSAMSAVALPGIRPDICELCGAKDCPVRCPRCESVWYCGRDHQDAHRPDHRKRCTAVARRRAMYKPKEDRLCKCLQDRRLTWSAKGMESMITLDTGSSSCARR